MNNTAHSVTEPFESLTFRYPWRDYQERALRALDSHLDDQHLHVIAAPGSGKTILGLEVMRKLGRPSIILAPTLTIRNQWIDRLTSMFLPDDAPIPNWISKDIRKPKYLTVITYQALHAAFAGQREEEESVLNEEEQAGKAKATATKKVDVIDLLKKQNISTIVLDEAHHLRKEWWKALIKIKAGLDEAHIVSLTATPPYDVDYKEWQRYEDLCGPIDIEISVPELVKRGDLCPHQDYVYFSLPTEKEAGKLEQFKGDLKNFLDALATDEDFLDIVSSHRWVKDTEMYIEEILSEPQFFSAIIIFLNACGFPPPKRALKILGIKNAEIPELDAKWLEVFLTGFLYAESDDLNLHEEKLESIRKNLKRIGAIERRKVIIDNTKEIKKLLASSLGKLESIVAIAKAESENLGDNLRMVVLADYIRKTEMPQNKNDIRSIDKIGVVPIFEYLRRSDIKGVKLGVLTGSIIIIPEQSKQLLEKAAKDMGIPLTDIRYKPVVHDENFVRIDIKGAQRQRIVHLITAVFNAGGITALVGTQALLGEGWDAPSINTLVLASYVGSYMLSNQMRGRAIRIDPNVPDKVANIWHLVSIDIEPLQEKIRYWFTGADTGRRRVFDPFDGIKEDLGHDIQKLRRRFRAFEGLTYNEPLVIENGFKRLDLLQVDWDEKGVDALNADMLTRACHRAVLPALWDRALEGSSPHPEMRKKIEANVAPKRLVFMDTLRYMVMNALIGGAGWGLQVFRGGRSDRDIVLFLMLGLAAAAIYAVPKLIKALYLWIRNGTLENNIKQVGWVVLESLQNMSLIKTNKRHLKIETVKDNVGVVYCKLSGATAIEKRHFFEAMQDILSPVDSPRYLLVRKTHFGFLLRVDYHALPKLVGQNKKNAEFFAKKWNRYVGDTTLVYTRSVEGRRVLLKARTRALSSSFRNKADIISVWE